MLYPNNQKQTLSDISRWQIFLPNGKLNPINSLANVQSIPEMQKFNARICSRWVWLQQDLKTVIWGLSSKIFNQEVNAKVNLPQGYHIVYGGSYAEQQQSFQELLLILIAASLLVFGVILFLFKEFKLAFIILLFLF